MSLAETLASCWLNRLLDSCHGFVEKNTKIREKYLTSKISPIWCRVFLLRFSSWQSILTKALHGHGLFLISFFATGFAKNRAGVQGCAVVSYPWGGELGYTSAPVSWELGRVSNIWVASTAQKEVPNIQNISRFRSSVVFEVRQWWFFQSHPCMKIPQKLRSKQAACKMNSTVPKNWVNLLNFFQYKSLRGRPAITNIFSALSFW